MPPDATSYRLVFPHEVEADAVGTFLGSLARLPLRAAPVVVEVEAVPGAICHRLVLGGSTEDAVLTQLRAHLPRVRVVAGGPAAVHVSHGGRIAIRGQDRTLAWAQSAPASLLAQLAELRPGEVLRVQWLLKASRQPPPADSESGPGATLLADLLGHRPELDARTRKRREQKRSSPWLAVQGRVGVLAASRARRQVLINRVTSSLRTTTPPGVRLSVRAGRWTANAINTAQWSGWSAPLRLNAAELVGLIGWPVETPPLPGLVRGTARALPPPAGSGSLLLAHSTYGRSERAIQLRLRDRLQHLHVLGPTGVGKSTLLISAILQDAAAGRGVVVIDPKGDAVHDVLSRLPETRADDVIVLDPTDPQRLVGYNPLGGGGDRDLAVDQIVGTFRNLHASSWGPRTADIMRAGLTTLAQARAASGTAFTLCELPDLLLDPRLRRHVLSRGTPSPELASFWDWYERLSQAERSQVIAPTLNKLRAITMRPSLRRTLGQSQGLNFDQVLASGQILLVPLQAGLLGPEATRLLGSLLVAGLWQAISRRSGSRTRRPVMIYLDEVQDLLDSPLDLGHALAQARGLGVGLALSHQALGQLDPTLRSAVLANARNKAVFRLGHDDARVMAREFAPELDSDDLRGLPAYEVALHLTRANQREITTGRTEPLAPSVPGRAARLRAYALERHGQAIEAIDEAAVLRRGGRGSDSAPPVGREAL